MHYVRKMKDHETHIEREHKYSKKILNYDNLNHFEYNPNKIVEFTTNVL